MTMQKTARIRVNKNGSVLIPVSFRQALGINAGDEILLRVKDGELRMTTLQQRLERAKCLVRRYVKPGTSLVDELIAERRQRF